MFEAKTPEAAAYIAQREATEKGIHRIWRNVALILGAVLLVVTGTLVYFAITVGQINSTVGQVQSTVNSHTTTLSTQARCEEASFNAILKDARLAFTGDKNAVDYAKAPKSC